MDSYIQSLIYFSPVIILIFLTWLIGQILY